MTSLATAVGGMKHWDWCPICRGGLDTGLECDQCGADIMPIYKAFKDLQARPTDSAVLRGIKARAARSRLGYGGKAWVTSDPKSEVVEDRMILIEIVGRQEFAINRLLAALNEAADSFKNVGLSVDAEDCERVIEESLSGGNPGEPKACTGAEERGISGATGAGQHPDGNPESTGDSADRRSPDGTARTPSPDESNRHFERGCHVIMELMQAYERRVRSDCTTQEQLDKRPWECAEYIKAAEYLRKVWPPHEPGEGRKGPEVAEWPELPSKTNPDILVDERCMDLAKHFLAGGAEILGEPQDCVANRSSLARDIQQAVEDWFLEASLTKGGAP